MYIKMAARGVRISRSVPVNDPRYSVNEGCFSDLLHTHRQFRSAEQHSISLSSLSKHKDNGPPMENREKMGFSLFPFHETSVETDLKTLLY